MKSKFSILRGVSIATLSLCVGMAAYAQSDVSTDEVAEGEDPIIRAEEIVVQAMHLLAR